MPSRNIVKVYIDDAYYHVYNRGVEKRNIFLDESDCKILLNYISLYISPVEEILNKYPNNIRIKRLTHLNMEKEIELLCFALMPNHFHLLLKQKNKDGIIKFMRRIMTSYVMYFNKKYDRIGSLFQGKYKAINIDNDDYLLHLSRYIHLNPFEINSEINYKNFSSFQYYTGSDAPNWIKPQTILNYFNLNSKDYKGTSYESFVEDFEINSEEILDNLSLDSEIKVGP